MRILLLTILSLNICFAQDEPKKINPKDLVDKVNRADLEGDESVEINNLIPTLDMPTIEFEKKVENTANNKPKKVTKNPKISPRPKVKKEKPTKIESKKIVTSKRSMTSKMLKVNDTIVVNNDKVVIFRTAKSEIVKYPYKGQIPLGSFGLKKQNNVYIVTDPKRLREDIKLAESIKNTKPQESIAKTEKTTVDTIDNGIEYSEAQLASRKKVEEKYNNGKKIKKSIMLKNLRVNDMVYIIKELSLVIRKKKSTSGVYKYWLTESLDINNPSVEKIENNQYEIIRSYQAK